MTEVRTLDSYRFTDVSALKIDVEGHELALLRGAVETIRRERPSILVEVDARRGDRSFEHAGPVIDWLAGFGYACRRMHDDSPNLIAEPRPG